MVLIVQYNARSLTKSNLVQFKSHLHTHKPLIIAICETFWRETFTVKFKNYNVINQNRQNQLGGGVAILIHKCLQFTQLTLTTLTTVEAIGASIALRSNNGKDVIEIISAYIPEGNNCDEDEIRQLTQSRNHNFILSGDFNAHHARWETSCTQTNRSGKVIANLLENNDNLQLITPPNLGTRQSSTTLKYSTIDLTIMTPTIAMTSTISKAPHIGSDHVPLHIHIDVRPILSLGRPPSWDFSKAEWTTWNNKINAEINSDNFYTTNAPSTKYDIFREAIFSANEVSNIILSKPRNKTKAEPKQSWWNQECKRAVAVARKARNACDPKKGGVNCATNRNAWKQKENIKKRIIIKAKQDSLNNHINSLNPSSSPAKT